MIKHFAIAAISSVLTGCFFASLPAKNVYEYEDMGMAMTQAAIQQGTTIKLPGTIVLAPLVHSFHFDNWGDDKLVEDNTWWKGGSDSSDLAALTDKVANQISARFAQKGFQLHDHAQLKHSTVAGLAQAPAYFAGRIATNMESGTFSPARWNAFVPSQTDALMQAYPDAGAVVFVDINSIWSRAGGVSFMNKESMEFVVDILIRVTVCQSAAQCSQTYIPANTNSLRTRMPVPMKSVGYDAENTVNPVIYDLYAREIADVVNAVISR